MLSAVLQFCGIIYSFIEFELRAYYDPTMGLWWAKHFLQAFAGIEINKIIKIFTLMFQMWMVTIHCYYIGHRHT